MQPAEWDQLKAKMRGTWMAGDFGQIARYSEDAAQHFVERLNVAPDMQVLDVACGTGNLALPAARAGAAVTGVDIAPNLLEQGRSRAQAENLNIRFDEGDAEELPYADASFDLVMTMFGAMFAPRPEKVAAELARVTRPGGVIAMANWTPRGFSGRMFALGSRYIPPPPGVLPPVLWGDEVMARERLLPYSSNVSVMNRTIEMHYPMPPRDVVTFFREFFGPTQVAFAKLDTAAQAAYSADLEALWTEHNESEAGDTLVRNEYLEVTATTKDAAVTSPASRL